MACSVLSNSDTWVYTSNALASTQRFAHALACALDSGTVITLNGDLGAGKTAFTKGFARGYGVAELHNVVSPTYTLVNEYTARKGRLFHMDWYRLEDEEAATSLGLEELIRRREGTVLVEWSSRFPSFVPPDAVSIDIEVVSRTSRRFTVSGCPPPKRFKVDPLD